MRRIGKANVEEIFISYERAARNIGYDTTGWNLRFTQAPVSVTAARGVTGTDSVEPVPGFTSTFIGGTYREAFDRLTVATRMLWSIAEDRPQTNTDGLYRYQVHGRYGTHHIDLYYDIQRDGSYTELREPSIEIGSRKKMQALAIKLNTALHTDPTKTVRSDDNIRYRS